MTLGWRRQHYAPIVFLKSNDNNNDEESERQFPMAQLIRTPAAISAKKPIAGASATIPAAKRRTLQPITPLRGSLSVASILFVPATPNDRPCLRRARAAAAQKAAKR